MYRPGMLEIWFRYRSCRASSLKQAHPRQQVREMRKTNVEASVAPALAVHIINVAHSRPFIAVLSIPHQDDRLEAGPCNDKDPFDAEILM